MTTFWIGASVLIALVCVAIGVLYVYWVLINRRFSTVEEDRVYRSGTLRPSLLQKKIRQLGIRTVIDLRRDKGTGHIRKEKDLLKQQNVQHVHLRSHQVPRESTVQKFLEIMNNQDNYPVLIHCTHGRGRAVLFSAVYLMEFMGRSKIRTCISLFCNPLLGCFNPLSRKGRFILNYSPVTESLQHNNFAVPGIHDLPSVAKPLH